MQCERPVCWWASCSTVRCTSNATSLQFSWDFAQHSIAARFAQFRQAFHGLICVACTKLSYLLTVGLILKSKMYAFNLYSPFIYFFLLLLLLLEYGVGSLFISANWFSLSIFIFSSQMFFSFFYVRSNCCTLHISLDNTQSKPHTHTEN